MVVSEKRDVSVVIVSFNTASILRDCLVSLVRANNPVVAEVIVVDNASTDGTDQMVRDEFPFVRLIVNQANRGFGAANNQGVAAAHGAYILLLNSDTVVQPGAIEQLVIHLEQHPHVGLVGPCLQGADGKLQRSSFRFPTPDILLLEQLNVASSLPVMLGRKPNSPITGGLAVDWLLGACLLGHRELLTALGPFDESFFMYGEDIDLCYRVHCKRLGVHLVPGAIVTHLGGMSTRGNRTRMAVRSTESMYQFYRKHYNRMSLALAVGIFRGVAIMKWLRDLVRWSYITLTGGSDERRRLLRQDLRVWTEVFRLSAEPYRDRSEQAST